MGRIVIKIPQNVSRTFHIASEDAARKLLEKLQQLSDKEKEDDEDILGLWKKPEPFASKKTV